MTDNLFFTEIMFTSIAMMALLVFWQLFRAKDGHLRVIMMTYFLVEFLVYSVSGIYFWMVEKRYTTLGIDTFRVIVILPKFAVKIWLLYYLVKKR